MAGVDEVRDRTDIVALVSDYVTLKKAGRTFKGLCPFHGEKTPSFVVYPDEGRWHCFGGCSTGGDAFEFVMKIENLDFRGALEFLARRAGVALEPPSPRLKQRQDRRGRLRAALEAAGDFYHRQLVGSGSGTGGETARAYLAGRGFGSDEATAFGLGWAPDAWSALSGELRRTGFSEDEMVAAGLARERDTGGVYDTFRARVVFPIRDARGRPVGFGARAIDPDNQPKYLNTPQTELFDKGRLLYALDRAAAAIRDADTAVVVEGYTDVIRAHAAGFRNVVASLGTALTGHHLATLKRYAHTVILALDADSAGTQATVRGLDVARDAAAGDVLPVPTAKGLIRYEHRMEVDLRVVTLPEGRDPDEFIRDDPAGWGQLVAEAQPVLGFMFNVLTADLDLDTPVAKTEAVRRLAPILATIPDPVSQAAWVAEFADRLRIDSRALAAKLARGVMRGGTAGRFQRRSRPPPPGGLPGAGEAAGAAGAPPGWATADAGAPAPARRRPTAMAGRTAWVLGHLLRQPDLLADLDAALAAESVAPLGEADVDGTLERDLLAALRNAERGSPPPDAPPAHCLDTLPEEHACRAEELVAAIAHEPPLERPSEVRWLRKGVLLLRRDRLMTALEGLRLLQAEASAEERADYAERVRELALQKVLLERLASPDLEAAPGKVDAAVLRRRDV